MSFEKIFRESHLILTEGALAERLKSEFKAEMDAGIRHAGLVFSRSDLLKMLYRQYIQTAINHDLPIMIMTPTRRVNVESIKRCDFAGEDIIGASCHFLNRIRGEYPSFASKIMIGGLMGCKGDAYSGEKVLSEETSYHFHRQQAIRFQQENIDFLFAGIMPEINEARGMARAIAETGVPYIISFMLRKEGCLLDGTGLAAAIQKIDEAVHPRPVCYMTNCIHPSNLIKALKHPINRDGNRLKRFCGIQANASMLSPEELNHTHAIENDDFNHIADEMVFLHRHFGLKIFGGCCGTNDVFMDLLTEKLKHSLPSKTTINL